MKKKLLRSIFICLLAVAVLGTAAFAATEASEYILKTAVGIGCLGNGVIVVNCTVTATDIYDDVGVEWIKIYQEGNPTPVFSHYFSDPGYSYLMGHDDFSYTTTVTYQGTIGENYYAKVCFYAGEYGVAGDGYTMGSAITPATLYKYP